MMTVKWKHTHIGQYKIIRLLGRGGMGTVYLCQDPELDRPVAVKVLDSKRAKKHQSALRRRFWREALVTARLQHPGVPPVYSVNEAANGLLYYVMKPIEGKSLRDILDALRQGGPPAADEFDLFHLVEILREVCQTIQYAHARDYIHRDLKPSNIFVGDYGEVYVIDWGLTKIMREESEPTPAKLQRTRLEANQVSAEVLEHESTLAFDTETLPFDADAAVSSTDTLTVQGDVLGTLAYMSPEQATGKAAEVGKAVDVYSLGVILYEILTLELPLEARKFKTLVRLKQRGKIIPPEERTPHRNTPPELAAMALQALAPNPEDRPKSVGDFIKALTLWLEGKSQFRSTGKSTFERNDFVCLPKLQRQGWDIQKETITTRRSPKPRDSFLLFQREFIGDIRFSVNVILHPVDEAAGKVNEFALILGATIPKPWRGYLDCYSVHLGANNNTRAYLMKNDSEVASNEYIVLEPRRRYRVTVEWKDNHVQVMLNRQLILFYRDRDPLTGIRLGFRHRGRDVTYSGIRIQRRGLPTVTSTLDIPEALMAEGCYAGACRRFLWIAHGHRNRHEGAWARYRAGVASYQLDGDRKKAFRIWAPLKKGPFAVYEKLGRAVLELEKERYLRAAKIIQSVLTESKGAARLDPVADIALTQAQQLLRQKPKGERGWRIIDAWVRLALVLGQRAEEKEALLPSILWRWIGLALMRYPRHLSGCIVFLRENFAKGRGAFSEILTTIDPLITILKRSAAMRDHAFLTDKLMNLFLWHDDRLGNLETLARFYLHAGHEETARTISRHIYNICVKNDYAIPPMPIAFIAFMEWLQGDKDQARQLFAVMVKDSLEWAPGDGKLLLGLDEYSRGRFRSARDYWREVSTDTIATSYNRHLIAQGLLGELPSDPVAAKVPNRSDHRLFYCLLLGMKHYLKWRQKGDQEEKHTATELLLNVFNLMRPSYDIYSATETFARIPLAAMGYPLPPKPEPEPLSIQERRWLRKLAAAASKEEAKETKSPSSRLRRSPTPRRG